MDNIEKTVLEFSVELFLNWHSDLYLENCYTLEIHKEIGTPIVSVEYFKTVESMVLDWEDNSQKTQYYIGITNAKRIDSKAVKTVIKQAKYQTLRLIDIDLIEFWNDKNPIYSYFIANELDPKENEYIRKLEQSDAQKTTLAAANLINIKVYQWLCEYEKNYELELLNPSVSATVETSDEKADGKRVETSLQMQLFEEINQFGFDKFMSLSPLVIDNVLSKLFNKSERSVRDVRNSKKSNSSNKMITHKGILGELIEKTPKR